MGDKYLGNKGKKEETVSPPSDLEPREDSEPREESGKEENIKD